MVIILIAQQADIKNLEKSTEIKNLETRPFFKRLLRNDGRQSET